LRAKTLAIVIKTMSSVSEMGLEKEETLQMKALKAIIRASEAQIHGLRRQFEQVIGPLDGLHLALALLQLRLFHLFCDCDADSMVDLVQLFAAAASVMDEVVSLDRRCGIATYCPDFVFAAVFLSAITVVKLLKSPVLDYVDANTGTGIVFAAIDLCKRISVRNNDVPAKVVARLSQLWSSDKLYRNPDGTTRWPLQVRDRFMASVIFDAIWWQRELSRNPAYVGPQPSQSSAALHLQAHAGNETADLEVFANDDWFLDMNWDSVEMQ